MRWSLFVVFIFQGCVSISTHERVAREAYYKGLKKADFYIQEYGCTDGAFLLRGKTAAEEMRP